MFLFRKKKVLFFFSFFTKSRMFLLGKREVLFIHSCGVQVEKQLPVFCVFRYFCIHCIHFVCFLPELSKQPERVAFVACYCYGACLEPHILSTESSACNFVGLESMFFTLDCEIFECRVRILSHHESRCFSLDLSRVAELSSFESDNLSLKSYFLKFQSLMQGQRILKTSRGPTEFCGTL